MAMAYVFETDTLGQKEYDEIGERMGITEAPRGQIAHLAGAKPEGGFRVVEVWESEDAASEYYSSDQWAPVREHLQTDITRTPWTLHNVQVNEQFHEMV